MQFTIPHMEPLDSPRVAGFDLWSTTPGILLHIRILYARQLG
jgi:hypothetical protein